MSMDINHPSKRVLYANELSLVAWQKSFFFQAGLVKREGETGWKDAPIIMMNRVEPYGSDGRPVGYLKYFDIMDFPYGYTTPGDQNIKGDEKRRKRFQDSIQINQERYSFESDGHFAETLVPGDFREQVLAHLEGDYWPLWFHEHGLCKLSGSLGSNSWRTIDSTQSTSSARDVKGSVASDGNDLRAPSTGRIIYGTGVANQAALTSAMGMSFDIIDRAVEQAYIPSKNTTNFRTVRPFREAAQDYYIMIADAQALAPLVQNVSARAYDLTKAMVQAGLPMAKVGKLDGFIYRSAFGPLVKIVPIQENVKFSDAATGSVQAARSQLLGADALRCFTSKASKDLPDFTWHEETDNRGNTVVVTTGLDVGFQKTAFLTTELGATRQDNGVVCIDTYCAWQ